jgi:hypothetical protein
VFVLDVFIRIYMVTPRRDMGEFHVHRVDPIGNVLYIKAASVVYGTYIMPDTVALRKKERMVKITSTARLHGNVYASD